MNIKINENISIDAFIFALEDIFLTHSNGIKRRQVIRGNLRKLCKMKSFKHLKIRNYNFNTLNKSKTKFINNDHNIFDKVFESPVNMKKHK